MTYTPAPKSRTRRRQLVADAKRLLAKHAKMASSGMYGSDVGTAPATRIKVLLEARAKIEEAIFFESGGQLGSSPARMTDDLEALRVKAARR